MQPPGQTIPQVIEARSASGREQPVRVERPGAPRGPITVGMTVQLGQQPLSDQPWWLAENTRHAREIG